MAQSRIIISTKPAVKPSVGMLLCGSDCASGINSSTTTYIIAPAAKDSKYGRAGVIVEISSIVNKLAMGSTIPDNAPIANALALCIPSEYNGIDSTAPSGKFCRAIPIANAHAADIGIVEPSAKADAKITPTAMPSGMLCKVTAIDNIVLRCHCLLGESPSGVSAPMCKCGISVSSNNRNNIPATNPTAAGSHSLRPALTDISIDGKMSDHMLAATITPDAKPSSSFLTLAAISVRSKNTMAEPNKVPRKGSNRIGNMLCIGKCRVVYRSTLLIDAPCLTIYVPGSNVWSVALRSSAVHCAITVPDSV